MLKNTAIGMAIGILVMGGVWGLVHVMGSGSTPPPELASETSMPGGNKGVMDLICELELDLDGQLTLGITENEPSRITMAQVDFDKRSGWYQGRIAISESRGGTLSFVGNKVRVTRPAMFQMFGTMISQEQFTIDRSTGAFEQQLTISEGKVVTLIKGTCAQVIKPPF